ncbi:preprotein translocase subunit SecG [Denitrificimonas sp. JX-1]|uniref:Protein-export membrane protein SecG n=1 Tax=Denitrificimonas halotolerans TaxID=3098930 RepID=A0ABU5GR62_9GAMM|nr:preprotein translocase subunit SecG [Denitrificimonas sp. JX-1]MDY7219485.1 preprotein translocase subunit SecG [Denitrificimonas sp. JX-1]
MLETVIIIVHLVVAIGVVGFVLIQQGKGADAGASFGSGASGTVFGSQGSSNFLSRLTAVLAAVFFATSLGLAFYAKDRANKISELGLPDPAVLEVPVQDLPVLEDIPQVDTKTSESSDVPVVD